MSTKDRPSVEYLRQCFRCEDGKLFWRERPREHFARDSTYKVFTAKFAGKEAGGMHVSPRKRRWWEVHLMNYGSLRRHQIVWAIHTGNWPTTTLDHKNRDSLDDRFENLRQATNTQNAANAKRNTRNQSGFKGVGFLEDCQKWRARIRVNRQLICLGSFSTPEEAHAAYCEAAKKHFGEFACDGNSLLKGNS